MSRNAAKTLEPCVDWVVVCESVARDETGRLSLIGIASHLPVPFLPLLLVDHLVVARLTHLKAGQTAQVSFGIVTPAGIGISPAEDGTASLDMIGDFVVITLRSLPLREEGLHRFEVGLDNGSSATVDVPVWLCARQEERPQVH
jgi:hypothetical protein